MKKIIARANLDVSKGWAEEARASKPAIPYPPHS